MKFSKLFSQNKTSTKTEMNANTTRSESSRPSSQITKASPHQPLYDSTPDTAGFDELGPPPDSAPGGMPSAGELQRRRRGPQDLGRFTAHSAPNPGKFSIRNDSFSSEASTPGGSLSVFHGTTLEGAKRISKNGFQIREKTGGFKEATNVKLEYPDQNHFFSTNTWLANEIARHQGGDEGVVLKVKLPPEYRQTLVDDPAYHPSARAVMSRYDTPASFITDAYQVKPESD